MELANFDLLLQLSNQFIHQQKLVRKIESIMLSQDESLITNHIRQYRKQLLKNEREQLKLIKTQFYQLLDSIPFNEEEYSN